jgi:hypothetical protein
MSEKYTEIKHVCQAMENLENASPVSVHECSEAARELYG